MSFMSTIGNLLSGGLLGTVTDIADKFIESDDEKSAFKLQMEEVLQKRDSEIEQTIRSELKAKENIIVAEMTQGDNYTKRARPTVIYFGLAVIFFNYCFIPAIQMFNGSVINPFMLPTEFWVAWGGTMSVYSVGRSMEKRGKRNKFTKAAVGGQVPSLFD